MFADYRGIIEDESVCRLLLKSTKINSIRIKNVLEKSVFQVIWREEGQEITKLIRFLLSCRRITGSKSLPLLFIFLSFLQFDS